jgi:uncharacterized membrane protein YedE/YeeE
MKGAALLGALAAGILFAVGLGVGGMTRPDKVIAFLDLAGDWDPSLAFVMLGAAGTYAVLYPLIRRLRAPLAASAFAVPARRDVEGRLLAGAAVFGLGWGAVGYCPGPAIVALGAGVPAAVLFALAMLAGMALAEVAAPVAAGKRARRRRLERPADTVRGAADA